MTRIERIAKQLYNKAPLGRHTHGEMVEWEVLSEELKDRWVTYAWEAIEIIEKAQPNDKDN